MDIGSRAILHQIISRIQVINIIGLPIFGFNGTASGPTLQSITTTDTVLMNETDLITWDVRYTIDSSYNNPDTVVIEGVMIDPYSQVQIGSGGIVRIPATVKDSAFTFGFELPQTHRPAADVQIALSVENGAIDDPDRLLSLMITNYDDYIIQKSSARTKRTLHTEEINVRVYPMPAKEVVHLSYYQDEGEALMCEVKNMLGQTIFKPKEASGIGMKTLSFDIRKLPNGIYHYSIMGESKIARGTFTIVR